MDDLSTYNVYLNSGFWGYIWNTVAYKFRPVSNLFMGIGFAVVQGRTEYLFWYSLFINLIAALVMWYIVGKLLNNKNNIAPIVAGVIYLVSRFSYYAMGQYFGVMETVALIFAVLTLYHILVYSDLAYSGIMSHRSLIYATVFAVLAVFSHERFICLFMVIAFAILLTMNKSRLKEKLLWISIEFILLIAVVFARQLLFANQAWMGTGGTNMWDTVDVKQIALFFFCGLLYFIGVNAGPEYLNGLNWHTVPSIIYLLNGVVAVIIIYIIVKAWISQKESFARPFLITLAFIGATLIVGCTTIRQEMRWLYVPYMGCIILVTLCLKQLSVSASSSQICAHKIVLPLLACIVVFVELFFRTGFNNIYFWESQRLYNALYEETVLKHQDDYGRPIVIVANGQPSFTKDTMSLFYDVYSKALQYDSVPEIVLLESGNELTNDILENNPQIIWISRTPDFLKYDSKLVDISEINNLFYQVGSSIRNAQLQEGFYGWQGSNKDFIWMAQKAELQIKTGENGTFYLNAYMPDFNLPNRLQVSFNGMVIADTEISEENIDLSIPINVPKNVEGLLTLELQNANVPYEVGVGEDRRIIGMCVSDITIN